MPTSIPPSKLPDAKSQPEDAAASVARRARERRIDQALRESFPASDPPGWTLGVTRPATAPQALPSADDDAD